MKTSKSGGSRSCATVLVLAGLLASPIASPATGASDDECSVVVLSPAEYALLTNRVDETWRLLNSTHENRCRLHGKPKAPVEIDETNLVKRTIYADGYVFVEPFVKKAPRKRPSERIFNVEAPPRRPGSISARQWNARKARERAEKAKPRQVNAEFAPGGELVSAAEVKTETEEPKTEKETEK